MQKSFVAIFAAIISMILLSASSAYAGAYLYGDEPYVLDWRYNPEIQSGCWRWNWQQYEWNDFCAVYIHPKAYMYPRSRHLALRTKG